MPDVAIVWTFKTLIHIFKKDANSWFDPLSLQLPLAGWCFNYDDPDKTSNRITVPKALRTYFTSLLLCKNIWKSRIRRSLDSSSSFSSPVTKNLFLRGRIATMDLDYIGVLSSSWDFSQSCNKESLLSLCLMTFTFHWGLKEGDRHPRVEERAGPEPLTVLFCSSLLLPTQWSLSSTFPYCVQHKRQFKSNRLSQMSLPTLPCSAFPQAKENKHKAVRLLKKETGLTFSTGDGCFSQVLDQSSVWFIFNSQSDRTGNIAYALVIKWIHVVVLWRSRLLKLRVSTS